MTRPEQQQPAVSLQHQHAPAVLANRLAFEHRWGQPVQAWSVCVLPRHARAALAAVQAAILTMEPSLLRVPEPAMHANLAWLLPSREEFSVPKSELWRRNGRGWMATVACTASAASRFQLRFRYLAATNSAVIAVAEQPNRLSSLRRELTSVLRVPGTVGAGDLAHITLFRYREPLRDPAALLRRLATSHMYVAVNVSELVAVREDIFPMLGYEILERIPLAGGSR